MPMMKSQAEVEAMLKKFDDADDGENPDEGGQLDCDGEAIQSALLWVLGHRSDATLEEYLEEM